MMTRLKFVNRVLYHCLSICEIIANVHYDHQGLVKRNLSYASRAEGMFSYVNLETTSYFT